MINKIARAVAVLILFTWGSVSFAQYSQWEYLGQSNVDGGRDHDRISVGRKKGPFRAIQIRVEKGPIEFDHVVIHFGNGQSAPIQVRSRIPPGGATRPIELPGGRRHIESVEFYYTRLAPGPKPKARLFGSR